MAFAASQMRNAKTERKIQETFRRKTEPLAQRKGHQVTSKGGTPSRPASSGVKTEDATGSSPGNALAGSHMPDSHIAVDKALVDVMPVSSKAYWSLQEQSQDKPLVGYPTDDYTGVPALRAWIRNASVPARQRHALTLLRRLNVLFEKLKMGFSEDESDSMLCSSAGGPLQDLLVQFENHLHAV